MEMNPIGNIVAGKIQLEIVRLQRSGSVSAWNRRLRSTAVTKGTITPVHRMSRKKIKLLIFLPFKRSRVADTSFLSSRQKYL